MNKENREYGVWLGALVSGYRKLWMIPTLPFVIIQLPTYDPETKRGRKAWSVLQAKQAQVSRKTDFSELINIKDLGDPENIHPLRKKEVGKRAAYAAWKLTQCMLQSDFIIGSPKFWN